MARSHHREEPPEAISEVNVVPLADVSLVLLIILLVLSPMMTQSMLHVKTAGAAAPVPADALTPQLATAPPAPMVLIVDLGPKGLALGGLFYSRPADFIAAIRHELSSRSDRKVFLAPHPDTPHGLVVHWMETLKSLGADSVALVQTNEENPDPLPGTPQ